MGREGFGGYNARAALKPHYESFLGGGGKNAPQPFLYTG
jgi:hypothetical protein